VNKTIEELANYITQLRDGQFASLAWDEPWLKNNPVHATPLFMQKQTLEEVETNIRKAIKRQQKSIENSGPEFYRAPNLLQFIYNSNSKKSTLVRFTLNMAQDGDDRILNAQRNGLDPHALAQVDAFAASAKYITSKKQKIALLATVRQLKTEYEKARGDLAKYNQALHLRFAPHCGNFNDFLAKVFEFVETDWNYKKPSLISWGEGDGWKLFTHYMITNYSVALETTREGLAEIEINQKQITQKTRESKIQKEFDRMCHLMDEAGEKYNPEKLYQEIAVKVG
jgi:hypothetical protein